LLFTWEDILLSFIPVTFFLPRFIHLRLNTLQLAAGMKGKVNRAVARQSEGGLGFGAIPL
jgi:hypothetical protein